MAAAGEGDATPPADAASPECSLQRVKLYRLNDTGVWDDKGTGHVSVQYMEVRATAALRKQCASNAPRFSPGKRRADSRGARRPLRSKTSRWAWWSSTRTTTSRCSSTASATTTSTTGKAVRSHHAAARQLPPRNARARASPCHVGCSGIAASNGWSELGSRCCAFALGLRPCALVAASRPVALQCATSRRGAARALARTSARRRDAPIGAACAARGDVSRLRLRAPRAHCPRPRDATQPTQSSPGATPTWWPTSRSLSRKWWDAASSGTRPPIRLAVTLACPRLMPC
jgi:hypothetical protein